MSVPKSKILSCSRGFLAQADVGINSPQSSQGNSQNVNIVVTTSDKPPDKPKGPELPPYPVFPPVYAEPVITERDVEIQPETKAVVTRDVAELITNKEKLIEALNLIIDIQQNNPLLVNKIIVAEEDKFIKLISLFTDSEDVELVKIDPEASCGCKIKYEVVTKIIVKKNGEVYNLKYNYPDVIEELDRRNISYKLVC